ncbi:MAG: preprotein translocase subunit SecE [Roseburia sp.]|nr:preprotein translocase subunit SecE [Roseburia sp.]
MGDSPKKNFQKTGFWKSVKTEFAKIVWPDKQSTFRQSVAVLCASIVLGLIIAFMDTIIQFGVNFITGI